MTDGEHVYHLPGVIGEGRFAVSRPFGYLFQCFGQRGDDCTKSDLITNDLRLIKIANCVTSDRGKSH